MNLAKIVKPLTRILDSLEKGITQNKTVINNQNKQIDDLKADNLQLNLEVEKASAILKKLSNIITA